MFRMCSWNLLFVVFACLIAAKPASAQESIRDEIGQVQRGGQIISIGDDRAKVAQVFGQPEQGKRSQIWNFSGIQFRFDAKDQVESILFSAPFKGQTRQSVGVGTTLRDLRSAYRQLSKTPEERLQEGNLSFGMRNEQVVDILMTAPPRREKSKPEPQPNRPGRPNRPRPGPDQDGRDILVIWEKTWRAADRPDYIDAPVRGWPDDRGFLLLRSTYGDQGRGGEQLFCEDDASRIENQDYLYSADIVKSKRKRGKPLRWQFRFAGQGPCKVQIIWFDTKQRVETYLRANPFDSAFSIRSRPGRPGRPNRNPDRWRDEAKLVWDHTWSVRAGDDRLLLGPKEDWPDDEGVLLIRALAGRTIDSFLFRAGVGDLQVLAPGDHLVDSDVLDRARRGNIFGGLAGQERKHLQFGFRGRGKVRVQVWWLPDRKHGPTFCAENTRESLAPWLVTSTIPKWLFQGPPRWRDNDRFESDWRQTRFDNLANLYNVAARRHGGIASRSSRDRELSVGSEFDGGLWYSSETRWASVESRFYTASEITRVDIATAGSEFEAASFITIELQREDRRWERVATLRDENINWCNLRGGRRAISRAPISVPVNSRQRYIGLRVNFVGNGPFRLGDLRAWGRHVGDYLLEEEDGPRWPGRRMTLTPQFGIIDSGIDLISGDSIYFDVEGAISLDIDDNGALGWCGPEGLGGLHCRSAFGSSQEYDAWRRSLAAPDLPASSLLLRVGNGAWQAVDFEEPFDVRDTGRLYFCFNIPRNQPTRGSFQLGILGGIAAQQPSRSANLVRVRCVGTITVKSSGRGVAGVDLMALSNQSASQVFGGGRSDAEGRFDFEVAVPRGTAVSIRAPEFRAESGPKVFNADGNLGWSLELN